MIPVCYIQNNAPHRRKTAIESSKISPRDGPQNNKNAGFLEKNREKQGRTGETGAHQTVSSASHRIHVAGFCLFEALKTAFASGQVHPPLGLHLSRNRAAHRRASGTSLAALKNKQYCLGGPLFEIPALEHNIVSMDVSVS